MSVPPARPAFVTDAHLAFLDSARQANCNMWTMPRHLAVRFDLSPADASAVLQYWMARFMAAYGYKTEDLRLKAPIDNTASEPLSVRCTS